MQPREQEQSDAAIQPEIAQPANAYQAYQLARYHFHRISLADVMKSRTWLEEAVRMDQGFAPAYVALAEQIILEVQTGLRAPNESFPKVREALSRASDLKLDSAEFYAVTGFASLICDWNFSDAETKLKKALELNPHHTFAHKYLGETLMFQGRSEEAENYLRRAREFEPMSLHVGMILALSYFLARKHQRVIEECERLLTMSPRFVMAAIYRCLAWEQLGRATEAIAEYERILREPDGQIARRFMGYGYALCGEREHALQTIAELDAEDRQHYISPTYQATIYAGLNENAKAISCLNKALSERDPWLLFIGTDPRTDGLRRDSRFNRILSEIGFGKLAQVSVRETQAAKRTGVTPDKRWQKIDGLFHEVLACAPAERAEFLATECAGDEVLRSEIESLISALEGADDFIETPAGDVAAEMLNAHKSAFEPGQQIENYQIVRHLGSGGMGEVYLAEDIRLKRHVALKLLPAHFTVNPDRVRRFEREARAASALNHPNIVTIYEIGKSSATHFIATEFVDGKTLRQLIKERPFTLNETLNVSMQIADALSGAHAAGIVHRDIKPENIMIRRDGYVKILDFGLAKLTEQQTNDSDLETPTLLQSNPGLVMGTVQYMSPEQARAKNVGVGTDIWSLGIVMYELLAGHVPFTGETPSHVMVSLMEDKLPPLKQHANVPDELDRFVTKTLCKSQKDRYQTAGQLARDLKELKQNLQRDSQLSHRLKTVPSSKDGAQLLLTPSTTVTGAHPIRVERGTATETTPDLSHPTSSAGYLVNEIKDHKRALALVAIAMVIAVMGVYLYITRKTNVASTNEAIDSVAVLPFVNVNNDPNTEYLSDGISDSIIGSLSQLPNLKTVTAFSSVLRYKGKQTDPQTVGRDLNVRAVLMGTLTQRGDDLSISAELVDATDNKRLWHGHYDRKLADALKLRGEIAQEISDGLRLKLTSMEKQQLAKSSTTNPEAYQLYLLGRFHQHNRVQQKARDYLEQAIKKDPNFAPAYAQLAYTYTGFVSDQYDWSTRQEAREKMERAARRALQLDDTLGDAHAALAYTIFDWSIRSREFQRALELDPNSADIHAHYARVLWSHRRIDEAILHMKRAVELDPLSHTSQADLGKILYSAGQREQAMEQYRKALDLNPNYSNAYKHLANYYLAEGRYEEAIAAAEKMGANVSDKSNGKAFLGYTFAVAGKKAEAEKILHELEAESKQHYVSSGAFALIYTGLGDKNRAFEFLQKEVEEHKILPIFINVAAEWASLRTDPRLEVLLQQCEWQE